MQFVLALFIVAPAVLSNSVYNFEGNKEIVKLLLKYGADPRAPDEEGTTPFDLARPHKDVLAMLHKANSKVDSSRDKDGVPCANCGE